jgi:hypothetical protein
MGEFVEWLATLGADQIDLGELIDPSRPVMIQYAQALWAWGTVSYGNKLLTIGLTAGIQNAAAAPSVYRGPDQSGPVNWPDEIGLHLYGPVPFPGHGSFYSIATLMLQRLLAFGMPKTIKLSIHERYDFSETITNAEMARLIADYPDFNWTRILQWPLDSAGRNTSPPVRGCAL